MGRVGVRLVIDEELRGNDFDEPGSLLRITQHDVERPIGAVKAFTVRHLVLIGVIANDIQHGARRFIQRALNMQVSVVPGVSGDRGDLLSTCINCTHCQVERRH